MRKNIFILFVSFSIWVLQSTPVWAQKPIQSGIFTIKDIVYKVEKSDQYSFYIFYRADRPSLQPNKQVVNGIPLDYIETRVTNEEVWKKIVVQALGKDKVIALKRNKERLSISFYFKPDGNIFYSTYSFNKETVFSLDDIALIDRLLMKRYRATFTSIKDGHIYKNYIAINGELDFGKEEI